MIHFLCGGRADHPGLGGAAAAWPGAVHAPHLSCNKPEKARMFMPVWDSTGESRANILFCRGPVAASHSIWVIAVADAVILMFRSQRRGHTEGKPVLQRVPITRTACHLGGRRPWFRCDVRAGGR
jgi:hypothetical protein